MNEKQKMLIEEAINEINALYDEAWGSEPKEEFLRGRAEGRWIAYEFALEKLLAIKEAA